LLGIGIGQFKAAGKAAAEGRALAEATTGQPQAPAQRSRPPAPELLRLEGQVAAVASEEIITAGAGEQHLDALSASSAADVHHVEGCRIGHGGIQQGEQPVQVGGKIAGLDLHLREADAEMAGDATGVGEIVGKAGFCGAGVHDREALQLGVTLAGQSHHGAGIKPAGEKCPERHIGHHLAMHCLAQMDQGGLGGSLGMAELRNYRRDRSAPAGSGRRLTRPTLQKRARFQALNQGMQGARPRAPEII